MIDFCTFYQRPPELPTVDTAPLEPVVNDPADEPLLYVEPV